MADPRVTQKVRTTAIGDSEAQTNATQAIRTTAYKDQADVLATQVTRVAAIDVQGPEARASQFVRVIAGKGVFDDDFVNVFVAGF